MINLLKGFGLAVLMSLPMIFAAGTAEENLVELDEEEVFGPRPDKHSLIGSTLPDIATALECLSCTANKKEFAAAKVEILRWMNAIELTGPSAIAIRAVLKKGVEDIYVDSEGSRDYGDTCMLALASRVNLSVSDQGADIRTEVVSDIATRLRGFSFKADEFAAAKVELLSKLVVTEFTQKASKIIWEILRDGIGAV